jgi:hypothetical protein
MLLFNKILLSLENTCSKSFLFRHSTCVIRGENTTIGSKVKYKAFTVETWTGSEFSRKIMGKNFNDTNWNRNHNLPVL